MAKKYKRITGRKQKKKYEALRGRDEKKVP